MPFVLLLLLALINLQTRWPEPPYWLGPLGSFLSTLGGIALFWLMGSLRTGKYCRRIREDAGQRRSWVRLFHIRQKHYFLLLACFFLASLYLLGWGWTVKKFWDQFLGFLPGVELAMFAPFLGSLIFSWARFYDVEKVYHQVEERDFGPPFMSRWSSWGLQVRFNLLLIVPPLFLMLLQDSLFRLFPDLKNNDAFLVLFTLFFLGFAFLSIPWLLRIFLGLYPLPAGPLRQTLETTGQRAGFRCNNILIWNTRRCMANAMVIGILPWSRYIVLTDHLVRELSTEEIQAVLGHEIGHVKHHHMFFYTLFLLGSLVILSGMWGACENFLKAASQDELLLESIPLLGSWLSTWELFAALPPLVFAGLYLYLVFGCLSRFCERQADLFGCQTVSFQVFINALEKVASLNGINRDKPGWFSSWRHPPIASRVDFLQRMQEDPQLEPRFQRRLGWIKWSMTVGLGMALGITLWFGDVLQPEAKEVSKTSSRIPGELKR
jgi:STE24 endopeptidase